jgi:hypothetical protein
MSSSQKWSLNHIKKKKKNKNKAGKNINKSSKPYRSKKQYRHRKQGAAPKYSRASSEGKTITFHGDQKGYRHKGKKKNQFKDSHIHQEDYYDPDMVKRRQAWDKKQAEDIKEIADKIKNANS